MFDTIFRGIFDTDITSVISVSDFLLCVGCALVIGMLLAGTYMYGTKYVNHGKLLKQIWTMGIRDKSLICIIGKILKSEIEGIGRPDKGTPQGGIISPLLSNIVLNELDWWLSDQWETKSTRYPYYGQYNS